MMFDPVGVGQLQTGTSRMNPRNRVLNRVLKTLTGFREAKPSGDLSTALEMTGRFGICIMPILGRRPRGAAHSDLDPWAGGLILGQTVG